MDFGQAKGPEGHFARRERGRHMAAVRRTRNAREVIDEIAELYPDDRARVERDIAATLELLIAKDVLRVRSPGS